MRLRRLGQSDLGAYIEAAAGTELWSIQRQIASEISKRRAHVAVPSCNASGKTYLGARLALAFFDAYTPGTPCDLCGGPCGGSKIITTSSKHDHLRHVLWGEIRAAYSQLEDQGLEMPGKMFQGQNLLIDGGPDHFIIGHSANQQEGFQGYHSPHKLILGDEATALDDEVSYGVTGLLASGDSRLLLIFNPTTPDTWAARESGASGTTTIKITAYDTPHFTGEPVPPRANLITPEFLAELQDKGMGPGCFDPETEVLTKRGWVAFPDLVGEDRVLSKASDGTAEWAPITKIHRYSHQGAMARLDGRSLDLFVTLGHRFPLVGRGLTSVADFRAEESLARACTWLGEDRKPVTFEHGGPGTRFAYRRWEFDPGDFAEFLGWYISEGNVIRSRNSIRIAQSAGRPETERIRQLLSNMGVGTCYTGHQFSFSCAPLAAWLDEHCGHGSANKRIPQWVSEATPDIHTRFLLAYELGDGHTRENGAVYATKSSGLVGDLQALLARYGVAGGWSEADGRYHVRRLGEARDFWLRREKFEIVPYDGDVWCISTPHQTFLARRSNRHPFWSGNTYEWTTRVEANFWSLGDDVLVTPESFDRAMGSEFIEGTRALGIDLAPYGTDENVIAVRNGNALTRLEAYPSMRQELFWEGPVADMVRATNPDYLIWDADGVGAGVYGYAEKIAQQHNARGGNMILLPFRGGIKVVDKFLNARSAWWWGFRRKFEAGTISLPLPPDPKLRAQVTDIRYSITNNGDIKVETKSAMRKRGLESPDRGDAAMYAFSMVDELPVPSKVVEEPVSAWAGVKDRSDRAMWRRDLQQLKRRGHVQPKAPWDRLAPNQEAWDDL